MRVGRSERSARRPPPLPLGASSSRRAIVVGEGSGRPHERALLLALPDFVWVPGLAEQTSERSTTWPDGAEARGAAVPDPMPYGASPRIASVIRPVFSVAGRILPATANSEPARAASHLEGRSASGGGAKRLDSPGAEATSRLAYPHDFPKTPPVYAGVMVQEATQATSTVSSGAAVAYQATLAQGVVVGRPPGGRHDGGNAEGRRGHRTRAPQLHRASRCRWCRRRSRPARSGSVHRR